MVVPDYHAKISMHLKGLGIGFLPRHICQPYIDDGRLVHLHVEESKQPTPLFLARQSRPPRPCFNWWLQQLKQPEVQKALFTPLS